MTKQTFLHDKHVELGARMVDFAGWHMPVQYTSIIEEHKTVRDSVGIFDVSHSPSKNKKAPAVHLHNAENPALHDLTMY